MTIPPIPPDMVTLWKSLKQRCYNPNNPMYIKYGAKGIGMSSTWKNDKLYFWYDILMDIGRKPPGTRLALIDEEKGFKKDNVYWEKMGKEKVEKEKKEPSYEELVKKHRKEMRKLLRMPDGTPEFEKQFDKWRELDDMLKRK